MPEGNVGARDAILQSVWTSHAALYGSFGAAHGLTDREQEIFEYLARGRNVRFIQEALVVSYNTVKTHVSHVYAKLDVHSHQELIDLVERTQ